MPEINLAPNDKHGLHLANPIMLAGGTIGYGEALHAGLQTKSLGAVVVGPMMRHSRAGSQPPRLSEQNGGFVLDTGYQNRGVRSALKRFARLWPKLGCPVIAQIADSDPDAAGKVAQTLADALYGGVELSGLELQLPHLAGADRTRKLIQAVQHNCDLPLLAKLPLHSAVDLASVAVEAGACGLVMAQPPIGAGVYNGLVEENGLDALGNAAVVDGALYGPLTFPLMMQKFVAVAAQQLPCSLIACGGIHTHKQLRDILAVGADAVQLDSAIWVEPGIANRLVKALAGEE